jgi:uncharacterized protein YchJ
MSERVAIPLRLSPDLHARLKVLAAKDERSLNAFIALALARVAAGVVLPHVDGNAYTTGARTRKVRPNDPCPCGSGTKHKRCHGKSGR